MLNIFSNLLQYISNKQIKSKQSETFTPQIIKAIIDVVITVEFNLNNIEDSFNLKLQPLFKFLETLFNFTSNVLLYQIKPNNSKIYQILNIFWPFLKNQQEINKIQNKQFDKMALSLEKIINIPSIYEIQSFQPTIINQKVINQLILITYNKGKYDFPSLFKAFLTVYIQKNRNFIQSYLKFFQNILNQNSSSKQNNELFNKCLNILFNLTNNIVQKNNLIHIFINRLLKCSNLLRNFVLALNYLKFDSPTQILFHIQKYYANENLLSLSLLIIDKIITFKTVSKEMIDAMTIISKLSQNWIDLDLNALQKYGLKKIKNQYFIKCMKFLIYMLQSPNQNTKLNSVSSGKKMNNFQMALLGQQAFDPIQFLDQQEMYQQLSKNIIGQSQKSIKQKKQFYIQIIQKFGIFYGNLLKNEYFLQQLQFKQIQELQKILNEVSNLSSQVSASKKQLQKIIIQLFPLLISDQIVQKLIQKNGYIKSINSSKNINNQNSSQQQQQKLCDIIYIIIIKKFQKVNNIKNLKQIVNLEKLFNKIFFNQYQPSQSNNNKILNYHFILYFMNLKKITIYLQDNEEKKVKEDILYLIMEKVTKLIQKINNQKVNIEGKTKVYQSNNYKEIVNKKLLILQSMMLLVLDLSSGSFKLNIKKALSNDIFILTKPLDLHTFITINQKQTVSNFLSNSTNFIFENTQSNKKLIQKFLNLISVLNNYNSTKQQNKNDMNLRLFIDIRLNYISLSLSKNHSIPKLIQEINQIRRNNSIKEFQVIVFSFCQYFSQYLEEKEGNKMKIQDQKDISDYRQPFPVNIAFHYLLKINQQIFNYDQMTAQDQTYKLQNLSQIQILQQKINILSIFYISLQQSLKILQNLINLINPIFTLQMLILVHKQILKPINSINNFTISIDKYNEFINEGLIIKLISELRGEKEGKIRIIFSQLALTVMKKLIQKSEKIRVTFQEFKKTKVEKEKSQNSIIQQNQQNQIQVEQIVIDTQKAMKKFSFTLQQLNLIYFPYKNQTNLLNLIKIRIQSSIIQIFQKQQQIQLNKIPNQQVDSLFKEIIQILKKNINSIQQIIIKQNNNEYNQKNIWDINYKGKQNLSNMIFKSILNQFSLQSGEIDNTESQVNQIFNIAYELLENDKICKIAQKKIGYEINKKLLKMIQNRIEAGINILQNKSNSMSQNFKIKKKSSKNIPVKKQNQIKEYLATSHKLYKIVKKIVSNQQINGQQILNSIILKDKLMNIQFTEYIMKQVLIISELIKLKSQPLIDNIFTYLINVNDYCQSNKQKIIIPSFLCDFFKIQISNKKKDDLKLIQKNDKQNAKCTPNSTYKCLKCDDKNYICYGCMIQCHKGHPIIYIQDLKFPRCQCRQMSTNTCQLLIKNQSIKQIKPNINASMNIFAGDRRQGRHQFLMGDDQRLDMGMHGFDDQQDFIHQMMMRKARKPKQQYLIDKHGGATVDPKFQKLQAFPSHLIKKDKQRNQQETKIKQQNFDFQDQVYESNQQSMQLQKNNLNQIKFDIASRSYYLPIFMQIFNQIYSQNQNISIEKKISYQEQIITFDKLSIGKFIASSWKAYNSNNYNVRIRKQIQLTKSSSVSKKSIACNSKFILISSGNTIFVHLKQKFFLNLLQQKQSSTFQSIHQHSVTFDIHSIDFSVVDQMSLCIAGLNNIIMFNISNEGILTKSNLRISVNNDYVNKLRTSKLGIFYSTSHEVRLLNWSFKQVLSIKSQYQCLLKQWCLYQKGSQTWIYCVTSQGPTQFIKINSSDQGKKTFTLKVSDNRRSGQVGSSVLVKDVEKIGKVMLSSFKTGTNIIGNLQGDKMQNISTFAIKNNFVDILNKNYILGHTQIIKGGQKQLYVIATIKPELTPEISIHQGQLAIFKIKKDGKCDFNLILPQTKCEYFEIIKIGQSNFSIISMHEDGSLLFSVINNPQKAQIDAECKKLKQPSPSSTKQIKQNQCNLKQQILKVIKPQKLNNSQLNPLYNFRQFSDLLKINIDLKLNKINNDYQITIIQTSNRVITGFCLPFIGNFYLPHRTIKNVVNVGLSNSQILYYYATGTLKFKVQKIQNFKNSELNEDYSQRFLQRLQKMQKYGQLNEQKALHYLNLRKQTQISNQISFFGQSIDIFKNRITKIDQIFNIAQDKQLEDKNLQKIAVILKIFIDQSIKNQNYLCQSDQIIDFAKNLRILSYNSKKQNYVILKELMVKSLNMYWNMIGSVPHVFNDQYHPLKYATEQRVQLFYELLKTQLTDSDLEQILEFLIEICDQNLQLATYYFSKYPTILAKLQKKSKKIQKIEFNEKMLSLYIIVYQVLQFKDYQNREWILTTICSILGAFVQNKQIRKSFYSSLKLYGRIKLQGWIKNINQIDGYEPVSSVNIINKSAPKQQNQSIQNNLTSLYGQFGGQFGMGQQDQDYMLNMAKELSLMQQKQKQLQRMQNQNIQSSIIQEEKQSFEPQYQLLMEQQNNNQGSPTIKRKTFLSDLIEYCTKDLKQPNQIVISKISTLYVVFKFINSAQIQDIFNYLLQKILKIINSLTFNCDNFDKHIIMGYCSVFSYMITNSKILKQSSSQKANIIYNQIKQQVFKRLQNVQPEKVVKLNKKPCILGKLFKGDKLFTMAHYSYGLVSLIIPPCEPTPILLSLECYWLLPQSKQKYKKMKNLTTINQGIKVGNINKIFQVAKQYPDVWREAAQIQWIQNYIQDKKQNWQKALQLLALYYESSQNQTNPEK